MPKNQNQKGQKNPGPYPRKKTKGSNDLKEKKKSPDTLTGKGGLAAVDKMPTQFIKQPALPRSPHTTRPRCLTASRSPSPVARPLRSSQADVSRSSRVSTLSIAELVRSKMPKPFEVSPDLHIALHLEDCRICYDYVDHIEDASRVCDDLTGHWKRVLHDHIDDCCDDAFRSGMDRAHNDALDTSRSSRERIQALEADITRLTAELAQAKGIN